MSSPTSHLDLLTRTFWRAAGREVDLAGEHRWLQAPTSTGPVIADGWLEAAAAQVGGSVVGEGQHAGLLADMAALDGPGFRAADLDPRIRDFYEHTADWRMEVWTQWTPLFWPAGEVISRLFGRRVQQMAVPTRPLDVARGMDSRVVSILDAQGRQVQAGWIRTLRATGEYVFSGCYSARRLPGSDVGSVHVAFPLEAGNVQIFLRPESRPDGSLLLVSGGGGFGATGAYVVVEQQGRTFAARAGLHEIFHVYVDPDGVLRTDHDVRLWAAPVVRLHYKLERREGWGP